MKAKAHNFATNYLILPWNLRFETQHTTCSTCLTLWALDSLLFESTSAHPTYFRGDIPTSRSPTCHAAVQHVSPRNLFDNQMAILRGYCAPLYQRTMCIRLQTSLGAPGCGSSKHQIHLDRLETMALLGGIGSGGSRSSQNMVYTNRSTNAILLMDRPGALIKGTLDLASKPALRFFQRVTVQPQRCSSAGHGSSGR